MNDIETNETEPKGLQVTEKGSGRMMAHSTYTTMSEGRVGLEGGGAWLIWCC